MPQCIYCKDTFDKADEEHILQNFLGARWDSPLIVCNSCQKHFGKTIDVAFERGLQPIRNLLGTRGGRGGEGPTLKVSTSAGEKIDLQPGGQPRLREPIVKITQQPDGKHEVGISLGTPAHLGWALAKVREQVPDAKVDEALMRSLMQSTTGFLAGRINLDLKLGGVEFFRGVVKTGFNLLAAHAPDGPAIALGSEFDPVRAFVRHGLGEMPDFIRWATRPDFPPPPTRGPIDHVVALASRGEAVEGLVQVFGHIVFPIRLTSAYSGRPVGFGYVVDPYREADPSELRANDIPTEIVPAFSEQSPNNSNEVQSVFFTRLQRILQHFSDQALQRVITDTMHEVLTPEMGNPFDKALAGRLIGRLVERMQPFLPRPSNPD